MSTKQLTIRGIGKDLGARLTALSAERGTSVNTLVLELLERAVGIEGRREHLKKYATWTEDDAREFDEALASQRTVDPRDWE